MNARLAFSVACMLLVVTALWGNPTFAQPAASHTLHLPIVHKPLVVRLDKAGYFQSKGYWFVAGQVTNLSNQTVYDLHLTAQLFVDGQLAEVITGTTILPATFPSGANLFTLHPQDPYSYNEDLLTIQVDVDSWSFEHNPEYLPLTVLSKHCSCGNDLGYLTGEIRNDNPVPVVDIRLMSYPDISFASGASLLIRSLAPGETAPYSIFLYRPGPGTGDDFTVWAQGAKVTVLP